MTSFISLSVFTPPLSSATDLTNSTRPKYSSSSSSFSPRRPRTSSVAHVSNFLRSTSFLVNTLQQTQSPSFFVIDHPHRIHQNPSIQPCIHSPIRCDVTESSTNVVEHDQQKQKQQQNSAQHQWRYKLQPGSIVEAWRDGNLKFGVVESLYERGVNTSFANTDQAKVKLDDVVKVSFGEIIAVWPSTLLPPSSFSQVSPQLIQVVQDATKFLRHASPKAIDLTKIYTAMRRLPKNHPRSSLTSAEISYALFKPKPSQTQERRAVFTVSAAILLATDSIHFKRSQPGHGWRALPPSVTVSRGRFSFVDMCNSILELRRSSTSTSVNGNTAANTGNGNDGKQTATVWSREQLDILRDLEVVAASGSMASGTSAAVLESLGYETNDDGAATLLLDINYWATGRYEARLREKVIANVNPMKNNIFEDDFSSNSRRNQHQQQQHQQQQQQLQQQQQHQQQLQQQQQHQRQIERDDMEWTFAPSLLAEARDLRAAARERRRSYMDTDSTRQNSRRRNLLHGRDGHGSGAMQAYCIDEKSSRFLDDAISVRVLEGGAVIRLWLHIADVDEVVRSGSALDLFAKERGQSMYLPLKPLHMLPVPVMDAASFSTSYPTEAVTVMLECDVEKDIVRHWEVFASIVPPVTRINYDQFDIAMEHGAKAAQLPEHAYQDLKMIAHVAPFLADKFDHRRTSRKIRESKNRGNNVDGSEDEYDDVRNAFNRMIEAFDDKPIASVKLIKRTDKSGGTKGVGRIAKVVNFQMTGSHKAVDDILTCAGGVVRQFAKENRAYLPEGRDAFLYVGRCGTAPLRRYSDLAIQRQIKCVLFGRQPAGKRRMIELKIWLSKRQAAAEKTVTERRRSALFDSFSSFCAQKCAVTRVSRATVRGQVRNVVVTKRGRLRADVALDGMGLSTTASVTREIEDLVFQQEDSSNNNKNEDSKEWKWEMARQKLGPHTQVQVEIEDVDTVAYVIRACIIHIHK